jgi:ketosteroid isomerase-like protein
MNVREGIPVKKLAGVVLMLCAGAALVYGQEKTPAAGAAQGPSVSQALQQVEHDWIDAMKAGDADKLGAILGDDWAGLGFGSGEKATKKSYLDMVKSGKGTVESFDFGPMSVKVLGNVAVVMGSDTQKGTENGKDFSGKYQWMDVFVKRNGNWVAVRSQTAKVE